MQRKLYGPQRGDDSSGLGAPPPAQQPERSWYRREDTASEPSQSSVSLQRPPARVFQNERWTTSDPDWGVPRHFFFFKIDPSDQIIDQNYWESIQEVNGRVYQAIGDQQNLLQL